MHKPSLFFLSLFLLSIFLASLASSSHPPPAPPRQQSSSAACKTTPYPKLCRTLLSAIRASPSDPYGYGKFSIKQSLKQAKRLSEALQRYLNRQKAVPLSHEEQGAIEDCADLAEANVDYLEAVTMELKYADSSNKEAVERVQTFLSAIVTNQQTCFDGLQDAKSGIVSALEEPLMNTNQLYSVSLGLVTEAMGRNLRRSKKNKSNELGHKHHPIKEPLNTLIKVLRHGPCGANATVKCINQRRGLAEAVQSRGLLIYDIVSVGSDGESNFTTITEALNAAPINTRPDDGYFVIYVKKGVYEEYIVVNRHKKNILMIGDGIGQTVITGNHNFVDGWTTYNSSSFAVAGERFTAVDMTFRNTAGPHKHQAVAVRNSADLSAFYRCSFEGYQDTLYVHSLRQFYRDCYVYGTIDFIFGNSAAVFQNCHLYARKALPQQKNAYTAQGRTDPNQNTGISIHNCTIDAAPDLAANLSSNMNFLGRPWKNYSRTVIMQSYIGNVVTPQGWLEWNGTVGLDTLFYAEFGNYGPGANTTKRVNWQGYKPRLDAVQALNYTVMNFTLADTWLPYTDIPFNGGLL